MTDKQDDELVIYEFGWKRLLFALLLATIGLVSEWNVTDNLTISAIPIVGVAVLVLLWPVIIQILERGGEISLAGLNLKVKESETVNVLKLADLEAQIGRLREQLPESQQAASIASPINTDRSRQALERAVNQYRKFDSLEQYRFRVETDRELVQRAHMVPTEVLNKFLEDAGYNRESQMAVAVVLGLPFPPGEELLRAELLCELLNISSERVRSRAARAAQRWGERADVSPDALNMLGEAVKMRLRREHRQSGARGYLEKADEVLTAEQWHE